MASRNYWVPWNPKDALIALATLKAEEIGVLTQIINLIYARSGPIDNDAFHIGKLCNIQRTKCSRIIEKLIYKKHVYLTEEGKLFKNRCEEELNLISAKRQKSSEDGQKGAGIRWESNEIQPSSNGDAINADMPKNNTNKEDTKKTNTKVAYQEDRGIGQKPTYNISFHLSDDDLEKARIEAPRWDLQFLMREYDERINAGTHEPPNHPSIAFLAWLKLRTQGKPPP